jgi:hypothetical protein
MLRSWTVHTLLGAMGLPPLLLQDLWQKMVPQDAAALSALTPGQKDSMPQGKGLPSPFQWSTGRLAISSPHDRLMHVGHLDALDITQWNNSII